MGLLTIGTFAKASRLSPKALRLYDELGLLTPARVDPVSGYRLYTPEQLDHARLVAWLRRLGMPLARIQHVCTLESAAAAQEIRAFWAQVEADTAARRDLASFLIDHLSWKDPAMSPITKPLGIRYAALSDTGLVRESNQDTAYAGSRLLAVADGFGSGGAPASAAAVDALKHLETDSIPAGNLLNVLENAIEQAKQAVNGVAGSGSSSEGAGTTLTAMLWTGSQLALVHIGDSRVHLLRDGELFQITHDHTLVQSMVDEGRLTPGEAASHPQRSLLIRALGQGADVIPDMRLHDAQQGDRYLLCSDGLSTVVPTEEIRRVLSDVREPERAVRELIALANGSGGPDNISCVVADVVELQQ
ncbi:MerR family transcriptional regulator [Streptomyces sp. NBC_01221]|uniref:MerR family transcriptional regulator n=1 Tax=unclassified Streptomyces TaxID=2593676 RepID=UPI002252261A|nr:MULTISPECIES: MerR family transcriptional regulator [unclassified Streptomyces]WSP56530.1 MerR family transcriptional regulator [Streptomyces sp. NBC_01241]WSU22752.1 MerR family transcriptional regulator [Streptomyces sp. NBC_01108]MCX4788272.1 MerR family transcriptional regulator [Streptomyces sp. NBC_01221]MCX4795968.1 MerR family transcriptional regulator [Streptomyces sp. NBC_01242]WSJ37243.1 MerR family transcriptional regulator [Streptomyces sp. NBC_01321]